MPTQARHDNHFTDRSAPQRSAVIVGASLSGLMAALTLSRAGVDVTMLERSNDTGRTGAAIHVGEGLLERITGQGDLQAPRPLAPGVQTWFAVHGALRMAVEADPGIQLHPHTTVRSVDQDASSAWAVTADRGIVRGDIVIGADGHRSVVRRHVAPERPNAAFAGYVIWIGIADEYAIEAHHRWPRDVEFLGGRDDHLLGYPLPGTDGSKAQGSRRLGWAWYDASRNGLLRKTGSVVDSVVRHSLMPADIPEATFQELAREARQKFPAPWRDAIIDCIDRRAVIGTPIAEYVPDRLVKGRVALVGDAAHVPTPMTGSGFSASLHDAEALAAAVGADPDGSVAVEALLTYEHDRLLSARNLVLSGQDFSRSFSGRDA